MKCRWLYGTTAGVDGLKLGDLPDLEIEHEFDVREHTGRVALIPSFTGLPFRHERGIHNGEVELHDAFSHVAGFGGSCPMVMRYLR